MTSYKNEEWGAMPLERPTLRQRVTDAAQQLLRYGGEPHCQEVVDILELLAVLNDDLCNMRSASGMADTIAEMHRLINALPSRTVP